jgi:hypothetical protein
MMDSMTVDLDMSLIGQMADEIRQYLEDTPNVPAHVETLMEEAFKAGLSGCIKEIDFDAGCKVRPSDQMVALVSEIREQR